MGNRAIVIFHDPQNGDISPAVYLHWNGGPESVYAFLAEMQRRDVRRDASYAPARFTQVVGDYFDDEYFTGLSLGIRNGPKSITPRALAPYVEDNGVYVVEYGHTPDHKPLQTMRRFFSGGAEASAEKVAEEYAKAIGTEKYADIQATLVELGSERVTEAQFVRPERTPPLALVP